LTVFAHPSSLPGCTLPVSCDNKCWYHREHVIVSVFIVYARPAKQTIPLTSRIIENRLLLLPCSYVHSNGFFPFFMTEFFHAMNVTGVEGYLTNCN